MTAGLRWQLTCDGCGKVITAKYDKGTDKRLRRDALSRGWDAWEGNTTDYCEACVPLPGMERLG